MHLLYSVTRPMLYQMEQTSADDEPSQPGPLANEQEEPVNNNKQLIPEPNKQQSP